MSKVSFGVFDWIDRGTQPLSQLYEDRLQLLAAAAEHRHHDADRPACCSR